MSMFPPKIEFTMGYRPCIVNGEHALFHQWVVDEIAILEFIDVVKPADESDTLMRARELFNKTGVIPSRFSMDKLKNTIALVEFRDGTLLKVDSKKIRFLDSGNQFLDHELAFAMHEEMKGEHT